ncbi:MAG: hypothetical protein KAS32_19500 [Candidatus Peribacteraceae bacterium]|nr:hypothetical protein [Candidatus Peribacteraceae bacterium]
MDKPNDRCEKCIHWRAYDMPSFGGDVGVGACYFLPPMWIKQEKDTGWPVPKNMMGHFDAILCSCYEARSINLPAKCSSCGGVQ